MTVRDASDLIIQIETAMKRDETSNLDSVWMSYSANVAKWSVLYHPFLRDNLTQPVYNLAHWQAMNKEYHNA